MSDRKKAPPPAVLERRLDRLIKELSELEDLVDAALEAADYELSEIDEVLNADHQSR